MVMDCLLENASEIFAGVATGFWVECFVELILRNRNGLKGRVRGSTDGRKTGCAFRICLDPWKYGQR